MAETKADPEASAQAPHSSQTKSIWPGPCLWSAVGHQPFFGNPLSLPRRSHLHGVDWDMEWLDLVDIKFRLYLTRRKQWLKGNQSTFKNRNRCQGSRKQCEKRDKCCHYKKNPSFSTRLESRQTWTTCAPSESFQGHSLTTHSLNNSSNFTGSSLCFTVFP